MRKFVFISLVLFFTVACAFIPWLAFRRMPLVYQGQPGYRNFTSNGEQIFFTATDQDGFPIYYTGGPGFTGMMMGSYLTCASCHGADARGGYHFMHMRIMNAPDIRYASLTEELEEHGSEMGVYDILEFRKAVVAGRHPDGKPLHKNMPRWKLNDQDLLDLFEYLKSLP